MLTLKFWATAIAYVLLYMITGIVFDGNHILMLPTTLTSVFIGSIFYFKKDSSATVLDFVLLIAPAFLLFLGSAILTGDFSRSIQYMLFMPIASVCAFAYNHSKKLAVVPLSIAFFYCLGTFAFVSIFTMVSNYGAERFVNFPNVGLLTKDGRKVNLNNKKNKVIVLDFWSTSCGICFEKFPDFQKTYYKFKNDKRVEIYAVNFPLRTDRLDKTVKKLDGIGYTFPQLFAESASEIESKLHFNTFPHLIIIKDGKIRYEGLFETESNTLFYSVESQIRHLLQE